MLGSLFQRNSKRAQGVSSREPIMRRTQQRRPVAVRAYCGGPWGVSECLISDLSDGGAGLVCGHTPRVGEQVTLEWHVSPQENLRVLCSVRHVSSTHIGLAFLGVPAEETQNQPY